MVVNFRAIRWCGQITWPTHSQVPANFEWRHWCTHRHESSCVSFLIMLSILLLFIILIILIWCFISLLYFVHFVVLFSPYSPYIVFFSGWRLTPRVRDPKGHGVMEHLIDSYFWYLPFCQCQAVQVCNGQSRNHSRRVDVPAWWPCWWAQAAWRSRIPQDGSEAWRIGLLLICSRINEHPWFLFRRAPSQ
jgi:hypothetical protein